MKSPSFKGYQPTKLMYIFGCLLIISCLAYFGRGWIRASLIPAGYSLRYNSQLQSAFNKANDQLQPADRLGLDKIVRSGAMCSLSRASGLQTEVWCVTYAISTLTQKIDASEHNAYSQQVLNFDQRARAEGWTGGDRQNDLKTPDLAKLSSGDYLLVYSKKINGNLCTFQLFSNPDGYGSGGSNLTGNLSCVR